MISQDFSTIQFSLPLDRIVVLQNKKAENTTSLWDSLFPKINVYVSRLFLGLLAPLETNALPYGISASET